MIDEPPYRSTVSFTFHAEPSTHHIFRPSNRLSGIGANFSPTLLDAHIKHTVLL